MSLNPKKKVKNNWNEKLTFSLAFHKIYEVGKSFAYANFKQKSFSNLLQNTKLV